MTMAFVPEMSQAMGPLVVSPINPRYFSVASADPAKGKVVYLTGSHVNNNLHDGLGSGRDCPQEPESFDFDAYLELLTQRGHNFIRLWRWEQFQGYLGPADVHFCMTPQPWPRTGPGSAKDGKPKFDLSTFDQAFFDRLRHRVEAAGRAGIYASVMLFEGFSLHLTQTPDNIEGHPFHAANNVNDIGITSIVDYQVLPLDPGVEAIQDAYIRKVIDTVHDLPNVLYEVANESSGQFAESVTFPDGSAIESPIGDSTQWQYWVIETVKNYERAMGYDAHPIGMTYLFPVADLSRANEPLWNSPADWISPGFDDTLGDSRWFADPPPNDGSKVVLLDTDHFSPFSSSALWVWKSFLRGHHPVLYDLGILGGGMPPNPAEGSPSFDSLEPARWAMGEARRFAEQIDLANLEPSGNLASSGYALAHPSQEYVALRIGESDGDFTVTVTPGTYAVRWHDIQSRETLNVDPFIAERAGPVALRSPLEGTMPVVVHLKATAR
jgi:hypothetical protein